MSMPTGVSVYKDGNMCQSIGDPYRIGKITS
nr:MAG TPA: hypothetical protein [Caudoviricetes sp.]